MLLTAAIVAGSVGLLVCMQLLRAALALQFPRVTARLVGDGISPPSGTNDLYPAADQILRAAGFDAPTWVLHEYTPHFGNSTRLQRVYRLKEEGCLVWLAPPSDLEQPNRLLTYFASKLSDGRWAVTQLGDCFFEALEDPLTPAQTVAATDLLSALASHRLLVTKEGSPQGNEGVSNAAILEFGGSWQNDIRDRLCERRRTQKHDDVVRPTFGFAARLLIALIRSAKLRTPNTDPVPVARQALLARVVRDARERSPDSRSQWTLFWLSAVLFIGIGWAIFGLQLAAVLLAVITFHELGHLLAMRAFGYRNTHITLLPGLGGVTIGTEIAPSSSRRAWIAMAGPLPGILLGWGLAALWFSGALPPAAQTWIGSAALWLLVINHLNLLPIPPLDGSLVVRSLLPKRALGVEIFVLLAGAIAGVAIAIYFDLWILAILPLLQLALIPQMRESRRLLATLPDDANRQTVAHPARVAAMLRHIEDELGPTKKAQSRITQAENIIALLDTKPIGSLHGAALVTLFVSLVAIPIMGFVASISLGDSWDPERYEAIAARSSEERAALEPQSYDQTMAALLQAMNWEEAPLPAGASADEIDATQERLGQAIPESLRALYETSNGIPGYENSALSSWRPITAASSMLETLEFAVWEGQISVYDSLSETNASIPVEATRSWWVLAESSYSDTALLLDVSETPAIPGRRVIDFSIEGSTAYTSMDAFLRKQWIDRKLSDLANQRYGNALTTANNSVMSLSTQELLDAFPKPTLFVRLLGGGWPDGANRSDLEGLRTRIGRTLPQTHQDILAMYNGFPPLSLLPVEKIARWIDVEPPEWLEAVPAFENAEGTQIEIDPAFLEGCLVVGGLEYDPTNVSPTLLWCPQSTDQRLAYVDLTNQFVHDDLMPILRDRAARSVASNIVY